MLISAIRGHSNNMCDTLGEGEEVTVQCHQISQGGGNPKCHVTFKSNNGLHFGIFACLKYSFFEKFKRDITHLGGGRSPNDTRGGDGV